MPTPDFIRTIRASAGHQLLLLPGVSAVVFDDERRVLLVRRADTGAWSLVGGIPEPGEQPAVAAVREVQEETAVRCVAERVLLVQALEPVQYPNGDRCQFMDTTFLCRAQGGEARVNDDESLDVAWFALDALPELGEFCLLRIKQALSDEPTWFDAGDLGTGDLGAGGFEAGDGAGHNRRPVRS
ncbi:NUDIX domain-containing protein [Streptomyces sp. MST-110588]|uniref:NUDIX hydrolase n=1 Tax=Streptomyces sp. MST-110588 TaxID=2833628 RepID=UPI001F5D8902|nr:NUDIX domain-containing protein [Streptomyces sp. MST-110588]UNO38888.1 NUDIX domain-containing protein [Streptomyces sp. MST-110588]